MPCPICRHHCRPTPIDTVVGLSVYWCLHRTAATSRPRRLIGNPSHRAHGVTTMIVVTELALIAAAAGGSTHASGHGSRQLGDESTGRPCVDIAGADESGQVTPPVENATAPEASSQRRHPFWPGAPAPAAAADHSGPAVHRRPASRVTADHHDAAPCPGRHHLRQRRRRCVGGRLFASDRHREVGNCDRNVYAAR